MFAFRLALGVGRVDVDQMLDEISSSLFTEWMAFYNLEPWGYDAANWRAGMQAATMCNINRKKNTPAYQPVDFMPVKKTQQTTAEMMSALKSYG